MTRKDDGKWLWCDRYGNQGGDNIALVRELEPGTGFAEAVHRLAGAPMVAQEIRQRPQAPPRARPVLSRAPQAVEAGRAYLQAREIAPEVIAAAEKAGFLHYQAGAVLFVGRDEAGEVRNATRRATDRLDAVQKRDLRGSDKRYPPILPGSGPGLWIVEGGADALALHSMALRHGKPTPTCIVSGGVNVRNYLDMPHVQRLLQREHVIVAGENERNPDVQAKVAAQRAATVAKVEQVTGRPCQVWTPKPEQGKDIADMNARARAAELAHQKAAEQARELAAVEQAKAAEVARQRAAEAEKARVAKVAQPTQGRDEPGIGGR